MRVEYSGRLKAIPFVPPVISRFWDRVVVLHGGRIVYDGSLVGLALDQEVRRAYLGERHITFVG